MASAVSPRPSKVTKTGRGDVYAHSEAPGTPPEVATEADAPAPACGTAKEALCEGAAVTCGGSQVLLSFSDGSSWSFHAAWLRDAGRSLIDDGWHRDLRTSVLCAPVLAAQKDAADPEKAQHALVAVRAADPQEENAEVAVTFTDGHVEAFPAKWLRAWAEIVGKLESGTSAPPRVVPPETWDSKTFSAAPFDYAEIERNPAELKRWQDQVFNYGVAHVTGVPADADGTGDVLHASMQRWIGKLQNHPERHTAHWKITTKESHATRIKDAPYNTSLRLLNHTDQTSYGSPGVLLTFHCVQGSGVNPVCDGFAVAEHLRRERPELFDVLSSKSTSWGRRVNFYDNQIDQHTEDKVIQLDEAGNVVRVRWNEINRGLVSVGFDDFALYWEALQEWVKLLHSDRFTVEFNIKAGEMITFNNWRCLHGRAEASADRVMVGGTIDKGAVKSRLRLTANRAANPVTWDEKFDNADRKSVV